MEKDRKKKQNVQKHHHITNRLPDQQTLPVSGVTVPERWQCLGWLQLQPFPENLFVSFYKDKLSFIGFSGSSFISIYNNNCKPRGD